MDKYQILCQPNAKFDDLLAQITHQLTAWTICTARASIQQKRSLVYRSLHASLALDHCTLSLTQLQDLAAGKRVVALQGDIQQSSNALALYKTLKPLKSAKADDLKLAHALFMQSVSADAGQYRMQGAGVYEDHKLVHMPPAPAQVAGLLDELFNQLANHQCHPLVAASVVHFQLAFIHPFTDANGRVCRLWQELIMRRWHSAFTWLPLNALLKDKARDYHKALRQAEPKYDATAFVVFMLRCINECLSAELAAAQRHSLHAVVSLSDQPLVDLSQFVRLKAAKTKSKASGPWYKTEDQILKKLKKDNRLSAKTIADELGLTSRAIEKQLAKLKAEGKLVRTGLAKGGRWQVVA